MSLHALIELTLEFVKAHQAWAPLIAGVLAWIVARWSEPAARWISLLATILGLALSLGLWSFDAAAGPDHP